MTKNRIGSVVQGSIFDCSKHGLEKALKAYDKYLYLKWNPVKNKGKGKWEIRRKTQLPIITKYTVDNTEIVAYEYKESNLINHVLDLEYLTYDCLAKLRTMDAWENKNWAEDRDVIRQQMIDKQESDKWDNIRHSIKQDKKYWKQLQEATLSGYDPLGFMYHRTPGQRK